MYSPVNFHLSHFREHLNYTRANLAHMVSRGVGFIVENKIGKFKYDPGGTVQGTFNNKFVENNSDLFRKTPPEHFKALIGLNSKNAINLYFFLNNCKKVEIKYKKLIKTLLLYPGQYRDIYDFKRRILIPTQEMLKENSLLDFNFKFELYKKGCYNVTFIVK